MRDLVFGFSKREASIRLGLFGCDELFASNRNVWIQGRALQGEYLGMWPTYKNGDHK
jgi:hypothetical protein